MKNSRVYQFLFSVLLSCIFAILWVIPLKGLAKFIWVQGKVITMNSYSTPGIISFIILSGFISFVVAKSIQYLKGKGGDINLSEFAFIFTISISLTTIFIFLGYPIIGFFVSGGVNSYIIPYFSYLFTEDEIKVTLTRGSIEKSNNMVSDKPGKSATGENSSNSGSNKELVKSDHVVFSETINTLRNILSALEKNNSIVIAISELYKDVDFKLLFSEKTLELNKEDFTKNILWLVVDKQSHFYTTFVENRLIWIKTIIDFRVNGESSVAELDKAYADSIERKNRIISEYSVKVENVSFDKSPLITLKQFIDANNWFNKALSKEVNLLENILMDKLRGNSIYADAEFRKIVNKEYPLVKKTFIDQDSYLRKKISDAYVAQEKKKINFII